MHRRHSPPFGSTGDDQLWCVAVAPLKHAKDKCTFKDQIEAEQSRSASSSPMVT
jgi:hypothetical protein